MVVLAAGTVSYIKGNAEVNRRERVVSGGEYCSTGCAEQDEQYIGEDYSD